MDDRANLSYAALPERLYIVQDGQVVYQVALRLEIFHQLKIVSFSLGGTWAIWLQNIRSWGFLEEEQIDERMSAT